MAAFFYVPEYTITVNTNPSGLDSPGGGGTYTQGTAITISVGDVTGYTFIKWQRDGADWATQRSFQYTVEASHTFTAIFLPPRHDNGHQDFDGDFDFVLNWYQDNDGYELH